MDQEAAHRRAHRLGRLGYLTYGVVQLILGFLALRLALGARSERASTVGAIGELAETPVGGPLVWVVAIGMIVLTLWQVYVAITVHDGWKSTAAAAVTALAYAFVAVLAFRVLRSGRSAEGGTAQERATSTVFELPGGVLLVGAFGVGIAAAGGYQLWKGITSGFVADLEEGATTGPTGELILWLGRFGYAAKGVALILIGGLFVLAGATRDSDKAGGLDQALHALRQQPLGPVLLGIVGVGFASYGLYCFARARYEKH